MSQDTVKSSIIQSSTSVTTATSNQIPGPRGAYTVGVEVASTGTSIATAAVVLQAGMSNAWIPITSATVLSTNAGAGTSYNGIAINGTAAYPKLRTVLIVTGTGAASVFLAS